LTTIRMIGICVPFVPRRAGLRRSIWVCFNRRLVPW
jgi:hypothetical protein